MDESFNFACQFNREGMSLLKSRHFHEAAQKFTSALVKFKDVLAYCEDNAGYNSMSVVDVAHRPEQLSSRGNEVTASNGSFNPYHNHLNDDEAKDWETYKCIEDIEDDGGFVFHRPFSTPTHCLNQRDLCVNSIATCLFNLALTNHLCVLQSNDPKSDGLCDTTKEKADVAMKFYELAYKMYTHQDEHDLQDRCLLAIINNLAHLHNMMNDKTRSDLCRRQLLSMLMLLFHYGDSNDNHHLDVFLSNVQGLLLGSPSSAPAA